jgi:hypothetical protein
LTARPFLVAAVVGNLDRSRRTTPGRRSGSCDASTIAGVARMAHMTGTLKRRRGVEPAEAAGQAADAGDVRAEIVVVRRHRLEPFAAEDRTAGRNGALLELSGVPGGPSLRL